MNTERTLKAAKACCQSGLDSINTALDLDYWGKPEIIPTCVDVGIKDLEKAIQNLRDLRGC